MRFEYIEYIQSLEKRISAEYDKREMKKANIFILVSLASLRAIQQRLGRIKQLLQISKYDLVFIGPAGVGKSTAICHLFNLIREYEEKTHGRNAKLVKKVKELLSTGSGRTTLCEVIIQPFEESFIEIEPYSNDDIEQFIEDSCIYVWQKLHPSHDNEGSQVPPPEVLRAIRNIADLKESFIEGVLMDTAAKLAKQFSKKEDFIREVINRSNLSQRTETIIRYANQAIAPDIAKEALWVENTFSDLNLARLKRFSIPKKIYLYISPNIIDFSKYQRFKSIVDTRGMDILKDRKDLASYIRDNDEAICIFADYFNTAPTNVTELIGRYLTRESKDIATKFALLVLPKKGEPENIEGSDGKVDSRDEGIAIRRSQIDAEFTRRNIKFITNNTLFYDALQYYLSDGRYDPNYEQDDIDEEKCRILTEINNIIDKREDTLWQEVQSLEQLFEKIKNGIEFNPEDEKLISDLKKTIEDCGYLNLSSNFVDEYIKQLKSYHVMVFHAINNRFGVYDLRGIDIYFESKSLTERLVRENLVEPKSRIDGAIQLVEKHASDKSELKSIMKFLKSQLNEYYEDIIIQIGEEISADLQQQKLAPQEHCNPFWQAIKDRWANGSGYVKYVLEMYSRQISEVDNFIENRMQELWRRNFMEKVLSFFGDKEY